MARVTVSVDDSSLSKIDEEATRRGISRSQCVSEAIGSYLEGVNQALTDLHKAQNEMHTTKMNLQREITHLKNQIASKDQELKSRSEDVMHLQDSVKQLEEDVRNAVRDIEKWELAMKAKEDEIAFLRAHVHQLSEKLPKALPAPKEKSKWRFWERG